MLIAFTATKPCFSRGNLSALEAESWVEEGQFYRNESFQQKEPIIRVGVICSAFPDTRYTNEEMVAEGDKVVTR